MFALMLLAASVHANFEAGNVEKVEQISETHFRCGVPGETDQDHRNRQPSWFYFRIDGLDGREITIDLVGLEGEYNYRPHDGRGLRTMRPVYSYDNQHWTHFEKVEWLDKPSTSRLTLRPTGKQLWVARIPPYATRDLQALMERSRKYPYFRQATVGKTVEGRPMLLVTITNPKVPDSSKKTIWLMARQHSWESGTSWVAEGAMRFLLSSDPQAGRIRDNYIFKIFPMADPDGVARGGVRFNKNGYDLNRNWDTPDARLMPEIWAQRKAVLDWVDGGKHVDLFLTLHNTESVDYIEGPLAAGPEMKALGQRFWNLLDERTKFYSPGGARSSGVSTTPGMKGRMSVNQGLFHERKIPAFLMELMVDNNRKLGRCPTVDDRLEFGAALAQIMCDTAAGSAK